MNFFSSDVAVAIAWICGIAGFVYALLQKQVNGRLKLELRNCQNEVTSLQNRINTIETDASRNDVRQVGEKNIYTKQNIGGMNINM